MQNKLRFTFFLLIGLISKDIVSQNIITGFIKDKSSNEFVPFSNVYMEESTVGTITDSLGKFSLEIPDSLVNSTLVISNIGYENYTMPADDAINTSQIIYLNKQDIDLPVFEKSAKKTKKLKTKTTGSKKKRNEGFYYFGYGFQTALFFHNDKDYRGFISKVKFYITDQGFPDTPFRAHVYSVDKRTGAPDKEILKTNLITSGVMGNEWVVVDILNQGIKIPRNGFFVAMEWLPVSKDRPYTREGGVSGSHSNGQVLGATNEFGMIGITWSKKFLGDWSVSVVPIISINVINAKIGSELKVYRKKRED